MLLQDFFCALAALLTVWGAMALACAAALFLARPAKGERIVVTVPAPANPEAAVSCVSRALARLSVTGALRYCVVAAVCAEENTEVFAALKTAFRGERRVIVCSKAGFAAMFLGESTSYGTR